jgi:hypothetical protein
MALHLGEALPKRSIGGGRREISRDVVQPGRELAPDVIVDTIDLIRFAKGRPDQRPEFIIPGSLARDAKYPEVVGQEVFLLQLIDRGQKLSSSEIAARAEDDHGARVGAVGDVVYRCSRRANTNRGGSGHEDFTA